MDNTKELKRVLVGWFSHLRATALWATTVIGAAVLGFVISNMLENPRPAISITSILPSSQHNKSFEEEDAALLATIPRELNAQLISNTFVSSFYPIPYDPSSAHSHLQRYLKELKQRMRQLEAVAEDLNVLDALLAERTEDNQVSFYKVLWSHPIIGHVASLHHGDKDFALVLTEQQDLGDRIHRVTSKEGDTSLLMESRVIAHDLGNYNKAIRSHPEAFRELYFAAILRYDLRSLGEVLARVRLELERLPAYRRLVHQIANEAKRFDRWAVLVRLINEGDRAAVFLPHARLEVASGGITYHANGKEALFPGDRVIKLTSIPGDDRVRSPVIVPPGESVAHLFVAATLEDSYTEWRSFRQLYEHGTSKAVVRVAVDQGEALGSITSKSFVFGPLKLQSIFGLND